MHREFVSNTRTRNDSIDWLVISDIRNKKRIAIIVSCKHDDWKKKVILKGGSVKNVKEVIYYFRIHYLQFEVGNNANYRFYIFLIFRLDTNNLQEVATYSRDTINNWHKIPGNQAFYTMRNIQPNKIWGIVDVEDFKFSKRKFNVGI